jgi:uncharacterized protein
MAKYSALREALRPRLQRGLIVAFSGGVDSAFLLWSAEQERLASGGRLLAVTAVSDSLPQAEKHDAEKFAQSIGANCQIPIMSETTACAATTARPSFSG